MNATLNCGIFIFRLILIALYDATDNYKYKKPGTLKILKSLAKYLDFDITSSKKVDFKLNEILVPGDQSIDITELQEIFSGTDIDARQLRNQTWKREK